MGCNPLRRRAVPAFMLDSDALICSFEKLRTFLIADLNPNEAMKRVADYIRLANQQCGLDDEPNKDEVVDYCLDLVAHRDARDCLLFRHIPMRRRPQW